MHKKSTCRFTLQPIGYIYAIVLHAFLGRVGGGSKNEDEDVKSHVGDITKRLNDNGCKILICLNLIHGILEKNAMGLSVQAWPQVRRASQLYLMKADTRFLSTRGPGLLEYGARDGNDRYGLSVRHKVSIGLLSRTGKNIPTSTVQMAFPQIRGRVTPKYHGPELKDRIAWIWFPCGFLRVGIDANSRLKVKTSKTQQFGQEQRIPRYVETDKSHQGFDDVL